MKPLDELFREAGEAHHRAFAHAGGDDPQWPRWYAEYLHPRLQAYARRPLGREELAEWLARMGREVQGPGWPEQYARRFSEEYGGE